jgi:hypothetical protein
MENHRMREQGHVREGLDGARCQQATTFSAHYFLSVSVFFFHGFLRAKEISDSSIIEKLDPNSLIDIYVLTVIAFWGKYI